MSELSVQLYRAVKDSREDRTPNRWHCSGVAKCPRSLYLERMGVKGLPENEPGAGKILRWSAGHFLESSIRPYLEVVYPDLLTNIRFRNEELDIGGEFDGYSPGAKELISVKSVHDYAMITRGGQVGLKERVGTDERGKAVFELKTEPYIHHQWQEHSYVLMLSHPGTTTPTNIIDDYTYELADKHKVHFEVERISYVYITLGGLIVTYTTEVKPEILDRVKKKLDYLNECWKSKTLPVCLCQEGQEMYAGQDQFCSFKTASGCCDAKLLETLEVTV